ncbi:hypothetical protein ABFS83_14G271000 [Erythranthe nasuta]
MAEVEATNLPTLAEHYLLEEKEQKPEMAAKPVEEPEVEPPSIDEVKPSVDAATEEIVEKTEESATVVDSEEDNKAPIEEINEIKESSPAEEAIEESNETPEESENQEAEETPEIKIETAPADFRFPTTNQTRHCFTRYIEYHRCVAAKGDEAPECDKFAKYYRSLCPGEWVDKWNEQRENGTFPGPL